MEVGIEHALGGLPLPEPPHCYLPTRMARIGAASLAIDLAHALRAAELPQLHRDPSIACSWRRRSSRG